MQYIVEFLTITTSNVQVADCIYKIKQEVLVKFRQHRKCDYARIGQCLVKNK